MHSKKNLIKIVIFILAIIVLSYTFSIAYKFSFAYPLSYLPHSAIDWKFVILNIILFSLFLLFIPLRRKTTRLPGSIYFAFIVALYIEMYGFPLTMYIITWLLGYNTPGCMWFPLAVIFGEKQFISIFLGIILPLSNTIILGGLLLIILGWKKIYKTKDKLVITGIYSYVRHPQYLGFLLLTLGMNFIWMAISTLLMWPILAFLYYRLAKEEEKQLQKKFEEDFQRYKKTVPMFFPRLRLNF